VTTRDELKARRERWRRFAAWEAPEAPAEVETRLRWLSEVCALAHDLGVPAGKPVDSQEIRHQRRRIRAALARIRD
jgi:hypothetical protein